jgi:hypothetical protein
MKTLNYILVVFIVYLSSLLNDIKAQGNTYFINGYKFEFEYDLVDSQYESKLDQVIYLYRNGQYVLKHYQKRFFADIENDYISYGDYSINGDIITFNTEYSQSGQDPIPEKRTQRYKVKSNGKLTLISDKEYYPNQGWINSTFKQ